jgi:hypothetical protein
MPSGKADLVEAIFLGDLTAPLVGALGFSTVLAVDEDLATGFATDLTADFLTGLLFGFTAALEAFATGLATTFTVTLLTDFTIFEVAFGVALLAADFAATLGATLAVLGLEVITALAGFADFLSVLAIGFFTTVFGTLAVTDFLAEEALGAEDVIDFPLLGAVVDFALGFTPF